MTTDLSQLRQAEQSALDEVKVWAHILTGLNLRSDQFLGEVDALVEAVEARVRAEVAAALNPPMALLQLAVWTPAGVSLDLPGTERMQEAYLRVDRALRAIESPVEERLQ